MSPENRGHYFQTMREWFLRTLLIFSSAASFWADRVFAQCDLPAALAEAGQSGCLSQAETARLGAYLAEAEINGEKKRDALTIVSRAYVCLLARGEAPQTFQCFRQILNEKFYGYFKDEDLCLEDRLTRAAVAMRWAQDKKLPSLDPLQYDKVLDKALNEFRLGIGVCRQIMAQPKDPATLELAAKWCVDVASPLPSPVHVQELVDSSVDLSMQYPNLGKHFGAVLEAILRDAMVLYEGKDEHQNVKQAYEILINLDDASLVGTSFFYRFEKMQAEILPEPDLVNSSEIARILQELRKLEMNLEEGARRVGRKSESWRQFERYSNSLYGLGELLRSRSEEWQTRDSLVKASCEVLWKGIELSLGGETTGQLTQIQEKLVNRIRSYGAELARDLKYPELVAFESKFLDESRRVLSQQQQCYLHAHLAQAYYVLGFTRESWEHLRNSCELVSPAELKELRDSVRPWIESRLKSQK